MQTIEIPPTEHAPAEYPRAFRMAIWCLMIPFSLLTAAALWQHGYLGIFLLQFQNLASTQVLADLGIALGLVLVWMWTDAKKTRRTFFPWALLTLLAGSFGPLLYLLFAPSDQ